MSVTKLLAMHFISKYSSTFKDSKSYPAKPKIVPNMSEDDWDYFLSRWEAYKEVTHMPGDYVVHQLIECCSEEIIKKKISV